MAGFLNKERLLKMKEEALLVNVGRGSFIVTENKIYNIISENLRRYVAGEELLNVVNFVSGYRT